MARKPTGSNVLEKARLELTSATTLEQFRIAQAVVLPLAFGMTLTETASVVGMTPGWVARARIRYIKKTTEVKEQKPKGGRRNSLLSLDDEIDFVSRAFSERGPYRSPVLNLKKAIKAKIGREPASSTVYKLIARVEHAKKQDTEKIESKKIILHVEN